jgi:hypothetical protein
MKGLARVIVAVVVGFAAPRAQATVSLTQFNVGT